MLGGLRKCLMAFVTVLVCVQPSRGSRKAQEHLGAGVKLFQLERYSEAAKEFELALKVDSDLSEARYYLAVSCFNERRYPTRASSLNACCHPVTKKKGSHTTLVAWTWQAGVRLGYPPVR